MAEFQNATQVEQFANFVKTHLDVLFEDELPQHPKLYPVWLKEEKAKKYVKTQQLITGLGAMPSKDVGGAFTVDRPYKGTEKTFKITTWGVATVFEYELTRWDQWDVFGDMTKEMAKSAIDRCNISAYAILNNGFSTSNSLYTVYNSEALFSTSHSLVTGGTTSNAGTSNPAISYTSIQDAVSDYAMLQNERGRYVRPIPKTIVVYPTKRWVADTLVNSTLRPTTTDNDKNTLSSYGIHDSPYLTSTTAWFLMGKPGGWGCFEIGDAPKTRSDFDHSTLNMVQSCYLSFRVEVYHYQGTWGSDGTGS